MRRVLVTGSRKWDDILTLHHALNTEWRKHGDFILVHGAALGADQMAHHWAKWSVVIENFNITIEAHPAKSVCRVPGCWDHSFEALGEKAGPVRNQVMVDRGADICLAFPTQDSIGTFDCMKRAEKAGIKVVRFEENPDNADFMRKGKKANDSGG